MTPPSITRVAARRDIYAAPRPTSFVDAKPVDNDGEFVRCVGCGIRGQWRGGQVINRSGRTVMPYCAAPERHHRRFLAETTGPRLRSHGPWLPDIEGTS